MKRRNVRKCVAEGKRKAPGLGVYEMQEIYRLSGGDLFHALCAAYAYGYEAASREAGEAKA